MGRSIFAHFWRRISVLVKRKLGPSEIASSSGLRFWRERIFHYYSMAVILVGSVVFFYYGLTFLQNGHTQLLGFSAFVYLSSLLVATMRTLPFRFRVGWVLFVMYLMGAYAVGNSGFPALGLVFFLGFSLLSGVLAGQRGAKISVGINVLTLVLLGYVFYAPLAPEVMIPVVELADYVNMCVAFVMVSLLTVMPLNAMLNGLVFNIEKERRYRSILHNEQHELMDAKKKAEESDRLKTAFLANMSHEIRTPMNAILGFSNLLSHPELSEVEKQEFVNLIRINGKNLMTLVEDIIDISKIESAQLQIKNGPCQLHHLLMDVYDSFKEDIQRRGLFNLKLKLKEGIDDNNLMILTDGHRLKQIMVNLVGNAIKFTEKGFVEFGYEVGEDGFLHFYVQDTGIGLPKGKEHEIFDRFAKFSNDKQRLYGGTGIGLSIAKHLVEMMGGEITVKSQVPVGTVFGFTLPYHRIGVVLPGFVETDRSRKNYNWEGKTFLVAEDEEDNFRYIEVVLALSNASLIWARDGKEAVDIFRKVGHIDLVLMDIKMPQMDGYAATQEIKKLSSSVPVIAQTAYAISEEREKSFAAGCDEYIAKPIGYDDLLRTIHKFVPSF